MRRFLSTSFIALALLISAAGAAPVVHAQSEALVDSPPTEQQANQAVAAAAAATPATYKGDTSTDSPYNFIMIKIMSLFAWLVGVAAILLDNVVYYTVVKMGDYVSKLSAIGVTWRILRDIANIMFIFGFLGAGIATILNVDQYGWKTKMLPMLLVGAVFLNFSLFITEAMIDGTNLFATQFYTQINGGQPAGVKSFDPGFSIRVSNEGISNKIMSQLGLQTIYGEALNPDKAKFLFTGANQWFVGFMGIILFIVTAFVLFSLAFILIARFVALIFFIILCPVAFMGLALPTMQYRAKQWWTNFLEQIITAPVLLLLLYVALAVITDVQFLTGFGVSGGASAANGFWTGFVENANLSGFAGMLLSFLIAMGLLLVVVIKAKSMSAFGAGQAIKLGGLASFGAVSLAGRATGGSLGNLLASKRMQSWARRGGAGGLALKGVVLAGKGLRSSTYDFRNAPGVTAGLGAMTIDAGKGATLTAKQIHDAQYGVKPVKEWLQHSAEEREQAGREIDFKNAQADLAAGRITQDQFDTIATPIISKMTTKQLEELSGIRKGTEALVRNLSPEQFESLMKSDKFNEVEKEKMRTGRYSSLHTAITAGNKGAVRQWSAKDLATALPDILKNPADAATLVGLMSEGQFDAVVKNDKLTKGQQQQLRDFSGPGKILSYLDIVRGRPLSAPALQAAGIIPAGMTAAAATAAVTPLLATMGHKKFAKLRSEVLTDPIAMALLTPKHLAALMTDGDLDTAQIHTIATAVRATANASVMTYLDPITNPIAATYWV